MTTVVSALAYAADFAILFAYAGVAAGRHSVRYFHAANAIGCVPIMASEAIVGAWPALVLTAAFGAIGWAGMLRYRKVPA